MHGRQKNNYHKFDENTDDKPNLKDLLADVRFYSKKGYLDRAMSILNKLDIYYPNNSYVKFEMAKTFQAQEKPDEAEECFKELIASKSMNANTAMYELAKMYEKDNRLDEGRDMCNKLLSNDYNRDHVLIILGDIELRDRNYAMAKSCYTESAKTCDLGYTRLAALALNNGQTLRANNFQKFVDTDSHDATAYYYRNQVRLNISSSHYEEAKPYLGKLEQKLESHPTTSGAYFLIKSYVRIGDGEHAHQLYDKYRESLDNTDYGDMAIVYLANYDGDFKKETNALLNLTNNDSYFSSKGHHILGLIYKRINDFEKSEEQFKLGTQNNSFIDDANYLELIYLYLHQQRYDEIEQYLEQCLASHNRAVRIKAASVQLLLDQHKGNEINPENVRGYINNQIYSYNKDNALEHIKRHTNDNYTDMEKSCFKQSVDIKKLFESVGPELTKENLVDYDICDSYALKKHNIGMVGDKDVDYMVVCTIGGTKDIITMFPVASRNYNSRKVINDDEVEDTTENQNTITKPVEKAKTYSAIDKFNKRYGFK